MKRVFLVLLIAVIAGCTAARQSIGPVKSQDAMSASPRHLALSCFIVDYNLLMSNLAEKGSAVMPDIDEPSRQINATNAKEYTSRLEKRKNAYDEAIIRRGFRNISGYYSAIISSGCKNIFFKEGDSTLEQIGYTINLENGRMKHRGVVVENVIVLEHFALNPEVYLVGEITDGKITLRYPQANCEINLNKIEKK